MRGSSASRITTGTLALLLTGAIGYGIHLDNRVTAAEAAASSWRGEAAGWQEVATTATTANRRVVRQNRRLVRSYNRLVADVQVDAQRAAEWAAAEQAAADAARAVAIQSTAPVPAVEPSVAQAPTSQAS